MSSPTPSPSPGVPELPGEDLASKFQRLLQEYAKIKKQNSILKKAVLQEQAKSKHLEEVLKEKEVSVRSLMEENDLLNFNNQRTTKRIEKLQIELQEKTKSEGGSWFSTSSKTEVSKLKNDLSIVQQELAVKIEENESLHIRIFDLSREHKKTLESLEQQVEQLQQLNSNKSSEIEKVINDYQQRVDGVVREKEDSQNRATQLELTLDRISRHMETLRKQKEQNEVEFQQRLTQMQETIKRKLAFDDTANLQLNNYNLSLVQTDTQMQTKEFIENGMGAIHQLTQTMQFLHDSQAEQLVAMGKNETAKDSLRQHVNHQLVTMLPTKSNHVQNIKQCMISLEAEFAASGEFKQETQCLFCEMFARYGATNKKMVTYRILSLQEESKLAQNPIVTERNDKLCATLEREQNAIDRLYTYLALAFETAPRQVSRLNRSAILRGIIESLYAWRNVLSDMSTIYTQKAEQENKNPFILPTIKALNDRVVSSHNSILVFFNRMISAIEEFANSANKTVDHEVRGVKPTNYLGFHLESRAREFLRRVNSIEFAESISYAQSIRNKQLLAEMGQTIEQLHQQQETSRNVVTTLEKEKKRLALELSVCKDSMASKQSQMNSLLSELAATRQKLDTTLATTKKQQAALEQMNRDVPLEALVDLDMQQSAGINDANSFGSMNFSQSSTITDSGVLELVKKQYKMTVIDESGAQSETLGETMEDREREAAIKSHFGRRIARLQSQLKVADAKAMRYAEQYEKIAAEVKQAREVHEEDLQRLQEMEKKLKAATSELELTHQKYQEQLMVMSEHLAKLNSDVSKQDELLSQLKSHKVHCSRCGIWNTVEWLIAEGGNGKRCQKGNHPSGYNYH